jgi:hypothetical protein
MVAPFRPGAVRRSETLALCWRVWQSKLIMRESVMAKIIARSSNLMNVDENLIKLMLWLDQNFIRPDPN